MWPEPGDPVATTNTAMREYKFITFTSDPPPRAKIRRMLADLGITERNCELEDLDGVYFVRMPTTDPRLDGLIAALNKLPFDPPWSLRIEVEYDRSDLESCEFVALDVNRAPKGDTGLAYGTEYDLSTGCPECGTGARQISALRINASALPKKARIMRTYNSDILIDHELANDLMIELRSDRGLRQVEDRRSHKPLPWWQILPDTYMPPVDPSTGLRTEDQCPRCHRNGFYGREDQRPIEYTYRMSKRDRSTLPDFVYTWEHGGFSSLKPRPGYVASLAQADVLISNRVMRILWARNIRGLELTPVRFVE